MYFCDIWYTWYQEENIIKGHWIENVLQNHHVQLDAIVLFIPLMEVGQHFNSSATHLIGFFKGSCDLHLKEICTYNYTFQESNRRENINWKKQHNICNNSALYKDDGFYFVVTEYRAVNSKEKPRIKYHSMVCV